MRRHRCRRRMSLPAAGPSPTPRSAESIVTALRGGGPTLVALSGGVDSAVVARLAQSALGKRAVAVTLSGPAVGPGEVDRARRVAEAVGIAHVILPVDPLTDPAYRSNPADRCFFCRRTESGAFTAWGRDHGIRRYVDGVHVDDLGDVRPGLRAMNAGGFEHPLLEGGWRKADVRAYARSIGLPNWDQPSDACLASRIQKGHGITVELLERVRRAEEGILRRGFRRVRVRTDGDHARVEVDRAEVSRLLAEPLASRVRNELRSLGFATVVLDAEGYRPRAGA